LNDLEKLLTQDPEAIVGFSIPVGFVFEVQVRVGNWNAPIQA